MKRGFKARLGYLLACGLPVMLLVGVVLWPQPQASGLAVSFVGFTNALGQPLSAVFAVTNLSRRIIIFVTPEPQVRTERDWPETVVVGPLPVSLRLDVGQGTNVTVAVPNRGEAWRMPIVWVYEPSRLELYAHRSKSLLRTATEGSLSGWNYGIGLTCHTNFSAEMELKPEPAGPANGSQPIRPVTSGTPAGPDSRR